jgi:hypothetical protein
MGGQAVRARSSSRAWNQWSMKRRHEKNFVRFWPEAAVMRKKGKKKWGTREIENEFP